MPITVSPLDLMLDDENPRFVYLTQREQEDIRKYLVTYEDTCQLAQDINAYGSLLPGERIVVLQREGRYVVIEGNRRTCSLQMLLSRELIPDGFQHKISATSDGINRNCTVIEVDVLPDRNAAIELMSKRHIEGVKQWQPIAKKQFFASHFLAGKSVQNLSNITGLSEGSIASDIKDYKFFMDAYNKYCETHPEFNRDIVSLKIDPFLRVFSAKLYYNSEYKVKPKDILKISYNESYNTISDLDSDLFNQIVQLIFHEAIIEERINTRNFLTDVEGILPLLQLATLGIENGPTTDEDSDTEDDVAGNDDETDSGSTPGGSTPGGSTPGGPAPGGPPPRAFFETIRWEGKLKREEPQHEGLLIAIHELYQLSTTICVRQKAYEVFPVATGMILRTVYEQALKLRLMQVGLWGNYNATISTRSFPTLSGMESFVKIGVNKQTVLPDRDAQNAFDRIIAATHRDFLNANIHNPGYIRVSPDSLDGIACGGMFSLIQRFIDLLP